MKSKYLNRLRNWRFFLEWATFIAIICVVVVFSLTASILPPPILPPESDGLVAKYGMRTVLFILFILGGAVCGVLFLLSRFPRLYRYPVKINADNVEIQYHLAKIALCTGQLIAAVVTCILMTRVYGQDISLDSADFRNILIRSGIAGLAVYLIYFLTARHFR